MKPILILIFCCCVLGAAAQTKPVFDKALADSLKADEYGMKKYVLVILKTGSNKVANKAKKDSLFAGHMKNIQRLADAGQLVVAGPMGKNDKEYRGIFILNVLSIPEAQKLLLTDPAVKADLLGAELYEWYGSAALPMYLKYHDKVTKTAM